MKINKHTKPRTVKFVDINIGDVLYYRDHVYMKTEQCYDDSELENPKANSVHLESGYFANFEDDDQVIPVAAELTIFE